MKLSDPKFAALARRLDQERVLVIAIAALIKEKHAFDEIGTILEIDPCITGDIGMEILGILNTIPAKKPRKASELSPMTREWKLTEDDRAYALRYRFSEREIAREESDFRSYWLTKPTERRNWSRTWMNRVQFQAQRLGKAAPLESGAMLPVSSDASQRTSEAPQGVDWKRAWARFRDSGMWPRGLGPEPGSAGCKMPPVFQSV
jgi:hypothetical protein